MDTAHKKNQRRLRIQTVQKLVGVLPTDDLDSVLKKLKDLDIEKLDITLFERDILNDVCSVI